MGLGINFSTLRSSLSRGIERVAGQIKPVAGVVLGAGALAGIGAVRGKLDQLDAKAKANLAKARGDVPAQTRAGVLGAFGGIPIEAVLLIGGAALIAFFVLRKK